MKLIDDNTNIQATIKGELITDIPEDLFIPPDALRVILEEFEGPLDLLLYLIKKQNIDIIDIPILPITQQYVEYIKMMESMDFELASDYLVMASTLAEIKSRMLLPDDNEDDDEEDPRANLVRRLLEYEKYKNLSSDIDSISRVDRDTFLASGIITVFKKKETEPTIKISQLEEAFKEVLRRSDILATHEIQAEPLSVRDRMSNILNDLKTNKTIGFVEFFDVSEGRMGVIVTFLAILELVKESLIDILQNESYSAIYLKLKTP